MIAGIGIDSVDVTRFENFAQWPHEKLAQIFSTKEIDYCLTVPIKSAERFAARFAAKEAFFKALCGTHPNAQFILRPMLPHIEVTQLGTNGSVGLIIHWHELDMQQEKITVHLSLTHTTHTATAIVTIENER